jgi:hypothetical protein
MTTPTQRIALNARAFYILMRMDQPTLALKVCEIKGFL